MEIPGPMPPLIREMLENPDYCEEEAPPTTLPIKHERGVDSVPKNVEEEEERNIIRDSKNADEQGNTSTTDVWSSTSSEHNHM